MRQSVEDGATLPLFYENRTPELQITNPELNEEIYQTIKDAGLDGDQEEKLRKVLGQRYLRCGFFTNNLAGQVRLYLGGRTPPDPSHAR